MKITEKKSRKLIIFEKVDLQREEILQFAWKWKWDIFDGFQTLCAPFPYLMHQKLTTSFFRLYHHSITLLLPWKKSFFSFPREFSTYMSTLLKKWGWIPQSFFKILINECEFFCLMNNSLCFCCFFRYVIAPMSLFLLATIPLPSAGIKGRSGY